MTRPVSNDALCFVALACLLWACEPKVIHKPATQVTLRIHASAQVRELGHVLSVSVDGGANEERIAFADVPRWPVDLTVLPAGASQLDVIVRAENARGVLLQEDRAVAGFVRHQPRLLELSLETCGTRPLGAPCEDDETCRGVGCMHCRDDACVPVTAQPGDTLPTLDPDATIPDDPAPACGAACTLCELNATRCAGDAPEVCTDVGTYRPVAACDQFCAEDGCDVAPSCSSLLRCGANQECCVARHVPGGAFLRSFDGVDLNDDSHPATLSPFLLDRFEVTVGRMRAFLKRYDSVAAQARPRAGEGKTRVPGDEGWSSAWDAFLPTDQASASAELTVCPDSTYSPAVVDAESEQRPVNCVSWYLAQAFCIWDGARLPTEAEWNFAAAGGNEQRVFPWSVPHDAVAIDARHAVYDAPGIAAVASRSPQGDGRFGHTDLAGNVSEWVYDWWSQAYGPGACQDCANLTPDVCRGVRGGNFAQSSENLRAGVRACLGPATLSEEVGFRCARPVMP